MLDAYTTLEILQIVGIGLIAGTLGGMLGVGGSTIIIPGLVIVMGRPTGVEQHLYQAAAMIANVAVSVPAALRHRKAGAMTPTVLRWMLPAAMVFVLLGVAASNLPIFSGRDGGIWLGRVLAVFMLYVIYVNVRKLKAKPAKQTAAAANAPDATIGESAPPASPRRSVAVGSIMGSVAGLMGIGGGAIAVPLQQTLLKLPLRSCIANSSAVICISAAIGAVYKNATLSGRAIPEAIAPGIAPGVEPFTWQHGLTLGLLLAPTAWAGGRLGASLTHKLPLRAIRVAFIGLMIVAAWKMAAL